MTLTPRRLARLMIGHAVDPLLSRLDGRYYFRRARGAWDRRARLNPRENTAAFDAQDWDVYWASGQRDFDLLLSVAREAGLTGRTLGIEVGCGIGRLTRSMAAHFERVVGVDLSQEMVKQAQRYSSAPNISYELVGSDNRIPAATGSVDLVLAWTVFRHVPKHIFKAYLEEAHRVLRPGGCLTFEAQIRVNGPRPEPPAYDSLREREYQVAELQDYYRRYDFRPGADRRLPSATAGTYALVVAWMR